MTTWHIISIIISAVNACIALGIVLTGKKIKSRYATLLLALGCIFVSVALYRSVFVSSYPNRLAWYDTMLNSPFVIRSLAFFAEIAFHGMIAAILRRIVKDLNINQAKGGRLLAALPLVGFWGVVLAQFFAYAGLITQHLTYFAVEETLWAVAFICYVPVVIAALKQRGSLGKNYRAFLIVMAVWCAGYLAFQCGYALPFSYYANLAQDIGKAVPPNALQQAISGYVQTRDFDTWGGIGFFIWHTGYFSICSWMTLLFMALIKEKKK